MKLDSRGNNALVSVIVPVYNSEQYLKKCIDSILAQSYREFELLLINDGSEDTSGLICDDYARNDSRIRVFHQENSGVSAARNLGLEKYNGTYFLFIDSDDYVQREYLEELMKYKNYDMVQCSTFTEPAGSNYLFDDEAYEGREQIRQCLSKYIYPEFTVPFGRLYKSAIQRTSRLFFDTSLYSGEDTLWVSRYLLYIRSVKTSSYTGYIYVHHSGEHLSQKAISYVHLECTLKQLLDAYSSLEARYSFDLTRTRLSAIVYFYHRYIMHLSESNFFAIKKGLKKSCANFLIKDIFYDETYLLKGKKMRLFNRLVSYNMYNTLALYVKLWKRYL